MNFGDAYPGFNPDIHRLFQAPLPTEDVEVHGLRKAGDPEHRKVVYRAVPHCDLFDLDDETQRGKYTAIMQAAADGKARIIDTQVETHPTTGHFRALIHWADSVLMPPGADQVVGSAPPAPSDPPPAPAEAPNA